MPISKEEYERSSESELSVYLLLLLRDYAEQAFSLDELIEVAAREGKNVSLEEAARILNVLVQRERAGCRDINGIVYYTYRKRPMGFRPGGG